MSATKLQAVRGMNDILPPESDWWEEFEERVRTWARAYGYRPIRTPIVEPTALAHHHQRRPRSCRQS